MSRNNLPRQKGANPPRTHDESASTQPVEEADSQISAAQITFTASSIYLSVPPPAVIQEYLPYYPDAAKKFFEWAEEESAHRRKLDEALVASQIRDSRLGLVFGLVIALAALGVAAFAAWLTQPWVAAVIGGGTLVSLARTFIVGKNFLEQQNKNSDSTKNRSGTSDRSQK